jgi:hypothetical protein
MPMRMNKLLKGAKTSKTDSRRHHVSEARYLTYRTMGMLAGTLETTRPGRRRPQDSYLVCVHDSLEGSLSPFALIAVTS